MVDREARKAAHEREVAAWEDRLRRYIKSDYRDDMVNKFILSRLSRSYEALRRVESEIR